ncbi:uncharacterized protein [Chironomus tepperi]|uniref:uncharacterized protein n=1 Tax=Chironomus tepperi TaxID=113505 RepID=UPI00391F4A2E
MKHHYKREGYFLSQLNHEYIIKLFDVQETVNKFILVLELIPENLCDFVRNYKRGKLEESLARELFRQITSAVAYIHEKGIIHRDIKLENILIDTNQYKVKLTDFGLSEEWDKKNRLTTICGSPEYSSPEIHEGKPYGNEVDVWALGVVLFAMVVGRLPFEVQCKKPVSNKQRRELFAIETRDGIRTKKHQNFMSSTSVCFKDLISKLLNPDPQRRIQIEAVVKHDWYKFIKIDNIVNTKKLSTSKQTTTPCSSSINNMTIKPRTAHVREYASIHNHRPITQAEKYQSLRVYNKVK